eukprot:13858814-Heterocapsa_arctica.AAC.1
MAWLPPPRLPRVPRVALTRHVVILRAAECHGLSGLRWAVRLVRLWALVAMLPFVALWAGKGDRNSSYVFPACAP